MQVLNTSQINCYVLLLKDFRSPHPAPLVFRGLHADCAPSVGIPPDPVIVYIRFKRDLLATALAFRLPRGPPTRGR